MELLVSCHASNDGLKPVGARFNQPLTYRFLMGYNQTLSTHPLVLFALTGTRTSSRCFIVLSGMAITNDLPSVFCWVSQMASRHTSSSISGLAMQSHRAMLHFFAVSILHQACLIANCPKGGNFLSALRMKDCHPDFVATSLS